MGEVLTGNEFLREGSRRYNMQSRICLHGLAVSAETNPSALLVYNDRMSRLRQRKGRGMPEQARQLETLGLIIIVILILAITITRSWHHINWSAR